MKTDPHQTVLLEEAVHALITNRGGTYVDCTYGRGGHSQAIANSLNAAWYSRSAPASTPPSADVASSEANSPFEGDPVGVVCQFFPANTPTANASAMPAAILNHGVVSREGLAG